MLSKQVILHLPKGANIIPLVTCGLLVILVDHLPSDSRLKR